MPASTERVEFDAELGTLFGGFPPSMLTPERKDAYWRGLGKMPMPLFTRVVDRALDGEHGEEKLPSVKRLWQISYEVRAESRAHAQAPAKPERPFDEFIAHGNRVLFAFLTSSEARRFGDDQAVSLPDSAKSMRGAPTPESLAAMIRAKNKLVADYRLICEEEPHASLELRDQLLAKFTELFVPCTDEHLARNSQSFERTHLAADFNQQEQIP